MRVVVFGAGGVGGNFGGYLAKGGRDVTLIARGAHLAAIRQHGLRIEAAAGDFTLADIKATDDPAEIGPVDLVLVCLKSWQVLDQMDVIEPLLGPQTIVLPLQNSVEIADRLARRFGAERVMGGLCYTYSYVASPGVIKAGGEQLIVLGELDHRITARPQALHALLAVPGIRVENPADIHHSMWKKFVWISNAGAVGAVTRVSGEVWRALPETRALFETVLDESFAVAAACGSVLSPDERAEILRFLDTRPNGFRPSMQRDLEAGNRSELQQQIGSTIRMGQELGVPVPLSAAIYASLLPSELRAQGS